MSTLYEQLNLTPGVSKIEIKKAYFRQVKRQPPEKYPEEFKVYRQAYEILMDDERREQYNQVITMPKNVQQTHEAAVRMFEKRDFKGTISVLKPYMNKEENYGALLSLLGRSFLENENYGNAVKVFEKLLEINPQDEDSHINLASAYIKRNFLKKARAQIEGVLHRSPQKAEAWLILGQLYQRDLLLEKAAAAYEHGLSSSTCSDEIKYKLYIGKIQLMLKRKYYEKLPQVLAGLEEIGFQNPVYVDDITEKMRDSFIMEGVFNRSPINGEVEAILSIYQLLSKLDPANEDISLSCKMMEGTLNLMKMSKDKSVLPVLGNLFNELQFLDEDPQNTEFIAGVQNAKLACLQQPLHKLKTGILYIKQKYPAMYNRQKDFFAKVQSGTNSFALQRNLVKELEEIVKDHPSFVSELMGEEIDVASMNFTNPTITFYNDGETYQREEPKVGRNNPCPCGSGKKYKKCCL
ncbi:MAG: tetratricopeptide repeat protein [Turicibacter sp.]|nr:tetratricopeptide repeat protein [Turicibacter sp.]